MAEHDKKLRELSIEEFLGRLGSAAPTPGGGAAAALESALGAALLMMVANHTIGKAAFAEFEECNRKALSEAARICASLANGIDADAEAFGSLSAAYKMPAGEEKKKAVAETSAAAAEAPLAVMRDSLEALRLAAQLLGRSNPRLESDIVVAARSLASGIRSASVNVDANLPAIETAFPDRALEIASAQAAILAETDGILSEIL